MSANPAEGFANDLRLARESLAEHDATVAAEEARLTELRSKVHKLKAQFTEVAASIAARNLQATLADEPLPEEDPRQARELRRLQATIQASEAAGPVLEQTISKLKSQRATLRAAISRAFWPWKAAILERALADVREAFAAMSDPIADLVALDEIQRRILGSDFITDAGVDRTVLISSGRLMERLLDGIPKQCRPTSLDPSALDDLAADRLAAFTYTLESKA